MSITPDSSNFQAFEAEFTDSHIPAFPEDVLQTNESIAQFFEVARLHDKLDDWFVASRNQSAGNEQLELASRRSRSVAPRTLLVEWPRRAGQLAIGPVVTLFSESVVVIQSDVSSQEQIDQFTLIPTQPTHVVDQRTVTPRNEYSYRPNRLESTNHEDDLKKDENDELRLLFEGFIALLHDKHPERFPDFAAEQGLRDYNKAVAKQAARDRSPWRKLLRRFRSREG